MDIKTLWGFVGNAELLGTESPKIKAGKEFSGVDEEYAHALIGKGLAVEIGGADTQKSADPKGKKAAAPKENK